MRILLGIPLLWLSLQSTGYAAGNALRELAEVVGPTIKSVMRVSIRGFATAAPRYSAATPLLHDNSLVVHSTARPFASASVHRRDFSTLPSSGDVGSRRFSTTAASTTAVSVVASAEEEIPWLTVDDSWEKIIYVTSKNCVKTVGTIDKRFSNPARWLNEFAREFSTLSLEGRSKIKDSRTLREDTIDTFYLWQKESPENLDSSLLTQKQKAAINNINVITLKASREMK